MKRPSKYAAKRAAWYPAEHHAAVPPRVEEQQHEHPPDVDLADMPPCLAALLAEPPPNQDDRVTTLRNLNIMFRKLCLPRETAIATLRDLDWIEPADIEGLVMKGIRRSSNYQCQQPVLRQHCNPHACVKRRLGICCGFSGQQPHQWSEARFAATDYGRQHHDGCYPLRVNGLLVRVSERALAWQDAFLQEVFEQRKLRLPRIPDEDFDRWVHFSWPDRQC